MFGVSFSELLVIALVCLCLLDIREITEMIVSWKNFIKKLFEIKDEVQETFADLSKEIKADVEYIFDSDKKLHAAFQDTTAPAKTPILNSREDIESEEYKRTIRKTIKPKTIQASKYEKPKNHSRRT